MRPLTGSTPKALLPLAGTRLVDFALDALVRAGCEAALIRVGHLGGEIERTLGRERDGMALSYCRAADLEDEALEAGGDDEASEAAARGPLEELRGFLSGADVGAIVPANRACRWPIKRMLKRHVKGSVEATLLVARPHPLAPASTRVEIEKRGRVRELRGRATSGGEGQDEPRVFLGACLLSAEALERGVRDDRGDEPITLLRLLRGLLSGGESLLAVETRGACLELPTPVRYLLASRAWARGALPLRLVRTRFVSPEARLEKRVRVKRSVIESEVSLERGSRVEDSLVLSGATVGAGSRIEHSIVAPGVLLSPRTRLVGRLVTPLKAGRAPGANDSVVGDLVYTPLGRAR